MVGCNGRWTNTVLVYSIEGITLLYCGDAWAKLSIFLVYVRFDPTRYESRLKEWDPGHKQWNELSFEEGWTRPLSWGEEFKHPEAELEVEPLLLHIKRSSLIRHIPLASCPENIVYSFYFHYFYLIYCSTLHTHTCPHANRYKRNLTLSLFTKYIKIKNTFCPKYCKD